LNPIDPEADSTNWIQLLWEMIIAEARDAKLERPKWFKRPTISKFTAISPDVVQRLLDSRKPASTSYAKQNQTDELRNHRARAA